MKLNHEQCNSLFKQCTDLVLKRHIINLMMELEKAENKHPHWPLDKIHAAAIVAEESGELVRATLQYSYEAGLFYDMHNEAIQTGAMALRFLKNLPELKSPEDDN